MIGHKILYAFPASAILSIAVLISSVQVSDARKIHTNIKQKTKLKNSSSHKSNPSDRGIILGDSIDLDEFSDLIIFSGYDKAASSNYESLCITNNSDYDLTSLKIEIIYEDIEGRMLNKREIPISTFIPSSETRTVSVRHYDRQKTLYFHLSNPPRKGGIPYKITLKLLSLTLAPTPK